MLRITDINKREEFILVNMKDILKKLMKSQNYVNRLVNCYKLMNFFRFCWSSENESIEIDMIYKMGLWKLLKHVMNGRSAD